MTDQHDLLTVPPADVMIGDARLMLGDCLERMAEIADGSVDMILCDLPYATTACYWDKLIPLEQLWAHYRRIIKGNGAIVLTASQPFTSALVMSNLTWFRYCWTWRKSRPTGHFNAKRMPLKDTEDILVFASGQPTYNPQGVVACRQIKRNTGGRIRQSGVSANGGKVVAVDHEQTFTAYPRQILDFSSVHNVGLHPTQKPVELLGYLILTYTNPGETVLDNAFGSASTGVACQNTGRRFIGIEKDEGYFALGADRMRRNAAGHPPVSSVRRGRKSAPASPDQHAFAGF